MSSVIVDSVEATTRRRGLLQLRDDAPEDLRNPMILHGQTESWRGLGQDRG